MSLQPQNPPSTYSAQEQAQWRRQLAQADTQNLKRGQDVRGSRIILSSPDGTQYVVSVANGGALSATPL